MVARFNRRILLRGLGGAAIAAPFLGSVAERWARGDSGGAILTPKRLIVMFTYHGCITNRWFPAKSHGALTAADLSGTTLAPLAPFVDKLLLPRGIRSMNEWTTDLSLGQGNDPYYQVTGSYFTCTPVSPHSDSPFDKLSDLITPMPTAPSLDHVCAQQLVKDSQPLLVRVANKQSSWRTAISFSADSETYLGVGSLSGIMSRLTGLFDANAPLSPDSYQVARGKAVLDVVRADLETLERIDMSAADRRKLADWKDLLVDTTRMATPACGPETAEALSIDGQTTVPYGLDLDLSAKLTDTLDVVDLYSNAVALSAVCQLNPVIFLQYPMQVSYASLGVTGDVFPLARRVGSGNLGGTCLPDVTDQVHVVDQFHARKFAHLVNMLNSFDEGEGKLLDSTATVWFQQFSDGCAMNTNNQPIIQAGSCGGYFKTGHIVNVFDGSADLSRGNSEQCETTGEVGDIKEFGTPPDIADAPINKYFCNLMNALGVKAGPDGFPLVGGTEEVRCFGMYDDTRDFASGGENPPKINDPGGFEELRA